MRVCVQVPPLTRTPVTPFLIALAPPQTPALQVLSSPEILWVWASVHLWGWGQNAVHPLAEMCGVLFCLGSDFPDGDAVSAASPPFSCDHYEKLQRQRKIAKILQCSPVTLSLRISHR